MSIPVRPKRAETRTQYIMSNTPMKDGELGLVKGNRTMVAALAAGNRQEIPIITFPDLVAVEGIAGQSGSLPSGVLHMVSMKTTNLALTIGHDGSGGATGVCYAKAGAVPVYTAISANQPTALSIPHQSGAPFEVWLWPATSSTSGVKGEFNYLVASGCQLLSINLSGNPSIDYLNLDTNLLTTLQVSHIADLGFLSVIDNQLTDLDAANLPMLEALLCDNNPISNLYLSGNPSLSLLSASGMLLTRLDLRDMSAIVEVYLDSNPLVELNVAGLTEMEVLYCNLCNLSSLDLTGCSSLWELNCYQSNITEITFPNPSALTDIKIQENDLTSLDLTSLSLLQKANFRLNPITTLDISGLTGLAEIIGDGCLISSITAVGCTGAADIFMSSNNIIYLPENMMGIDAVWSMLNQMAEAGYVPSYINLTDNPCDANDGAPPSLVENGVHSQAEIQALLTEKNYTLVLNDGLLAP